MIHLHATRKLFDRLPLAENGQLPVTSRSEWLYEQPPVDINPLSGWHGNLITIQRRNCLLLVHDTTRFPLVFTALTKHDFIELNHRFEDMLMNTLLKCGADDALMDAARHYLQPLQLDSQCNRSVQGTLNQMKQDVEHIVWYERLNVADMLGYSLGAMLADRPCNAKGRGCLWPQSEMFALLTSLPVIKKPNAAQDPMLDLPDTVVQLSNFRKR
ncbi:MAG: hypothetical protein R3271_05855 [Methylophaga sp.]|uniref:DUF6933 domain-containing protein n=1 Tax=Methylophaga sp. TaxID=2024840 RepID=UPI00299E2B5F|nr:hypothetical protein [Methylophaga sp.]MDX1749827.1 hypothetical protein [Methylophaga sp.]